MVSEILPRWRSVSPPPLHGHPFRLCGAFFCSRNAVLRVAVFTTLILFSLICYMTALTPSSSLSLSSLDWYGLSRVHPNSPEHVLADGSLTTPTEDDILSFTPIETAPWPPAPLLLPDELTLEQVRDIVAPTRGFFSRDYSVHLGWNNVSLCVIGNE
jgi:hypothetical protein